jgi:hypothetical protein
MGFELSEWMSIGVDAPYLVTIRLRSARRTYQSTHIRSLTFFSNSINFSGDYYTATSRGLKGF